MQGWRVGMEDAHTTEPRFDEDARISLFAVFDGHGGPEVAHYCGEHIAEAVRSTAACVARAWRARDGARFCFPAETPRR